MHFTLSCVLYSMQHGRARLIRMSALFPSSPTPTAACKTTPTASEEGGRRGAAALVVNVELAVNRVPRAVERRRGHQRQNAATVLAGHAAIDFRRRGTEESDHEGAEDEDINNEENGKEKEEVENEEEDQGRQDDDHVDEGETEKREEEQYTSSSKHGGATLTMLLTSSCRDEHNNLVTD